MFVILNVMKYSEESKRFFILQDDKRYAFTLVLYNGF